MGVTSEVLSERAGWSPYATPTTSPYASMVAPAPPRGGGGGGGGGSVAGVEGLDVAQRMVVDMVVAKVAEEMVGFRVLCEELGFRGRV